MLQPRVFLNKYQRFVLRLVVGWLIIIQPGLAQANGGTTLAVERSGPYEIAVTASPFPLEVGATQDISVLLGRLSDAEIVLDADITLTAEPLDQPGALQTFSVTHDNAINKLYYAANIVFPAPGRWRLTVQVDGPEGPARTTFEVQVERGQSPGILRYLGPVVVALGAIAFLLAIILGRNSRISRQEEIDDFNDQ